ncbi:MAG: hypothetical protein IJB00_06915 [Akkermansia sp.]|nr:hypothetical protein [Akkermansia sp.]
MFDFSEMCSRLFGGISLPELNNMLPATDASLAGIIGAVLLGIWLLTKVMRALAGTLCVVCLLYVAVRLGLGIDPLPYLLP